MRKTLIALAVAGTAALPLAGYAHNTYRSHMGGQVSGETESGPVFSFSDQLTGVYADSIGHSGPNAAAYDSYVVPSASGPAQVSSIADEGLSSSIGSSDQMASSTTWYFPDGSVAYEMPGLALSSGPDSMGQNYTETWVISEVQPDYYLIYGG